MTEVERRGRNPDRAGLFGMMRPMLEAGRANYQKALTTAQAILTPEQWAMVPERVKKQRGGQERRPPTRPP